MPTTQWGEAIARLLAERGWTKKQLAEAAKVRPNTLTNLIKHGRDSDTATLGRIAAALKVDIAELFLAREQSVVLRAHRENRVERLKDAVMKELSETVSKLVQRELARAGEVEGGRPPEAPHAPRGTRRRRRSRPSREHKKA